LKDYIVPPSENNAIFIMTNYIKTEQSRSKCVESKYLSEAKCTRDRDCRNTSSKSNMNGRWTGRCSLSSKIDTFVKTGNTTKQSTRLCEIEGKVMRMFKLPFSFFIIHYGMISQGYRTVDKRFDLLQNIICHAMD
jgi:hypothetical protein